MRQILTLGAVLVAVGACGGTTTIGQGRGQMDPDAGSATTSGTGTTGSAGRGSQVGGKSGGSVAEGGSASGFGGATGVGVAGSSAVGLKCTTDGDCLALQTCEPCPDGSPLCNDVVCQNGMCAIFDIYKKCASACEPAFCPQSSGKGIACCLSAGGPCGLDYGMGCVNATDLPLDECQTDKDCPIPPMLCLPCPDSTCSPTHTRCTGGKCDSGYDACPSALHWYQTCGDPPPCTGPAPDAAPCNVAAGEKENGPCPKDGLVCNPGLGCGILLQCHLPTPGPSCPK